MHLRSDQGWLNWQNAVKFSTVLFPSYTLLSKQLLFLLIISRLCSTIKKIYKKILKSHHNFFLSRISTCQGSWHDDQMTNRHCSFLGGFYRSCTVLITHTHAGICVETVHVKKLNSTLVQNKLCGSRECKLFLNSQRRLFCTTVSQTNRNTLNFLLCWVLCPSVTQL